MVLASPQTAGEPVDLSATVALELRTTVLCLDAQLLLGVLALLYPAQLVLTLSHRRLLGGQPLREGGPLPGGLLHLLLETGQMSLERLHRCLGRLGPAGERLCRVGGVGVYGAACPALGQQVALGWRLRLVSRRL